MMDSVVGSRSGSVVVWLPQYRWKFPAMAIVMSSPTSRFQLSFTLIQLYVVDVLNGLVNPGGSMPMFRQQQITICPVFVCPGRMLYVSRFGGVWHACSGRESRSSFVKTDTYGSTLKQQTCVKMDGCICFFSTGQPTGYLKATRTVNKRSSMGDGAWEPQRGTYRRGST